MENWIDVIFGAVISLAVGIISFFLKGALRRGEQNASEVARIREDYTSKRQHEKAIDECRADIKQIRDDYLTKEDFYRVMGETNRTVEKIDNKLDRLMAMITEIKGARE